MGTAHQRAKPRAQSTPDSAAEARAEIRTGQSRGKQMAAGKGAEKAHRAQRSGLKNDRFLGHVKMSDTEPLHLYTSSALRLSRSTPHQPIGSSAQRPTSPTPQQITSPAAGKAAFIIHSRTRNNGTESYIRFMKIKDFKKIKRKNPLKILKSLNFSNRYIENCSTPTPKTRNPLSHKGVGGGTKGGTNV